MKRLVTALALAGSTAVALYASSAPATAASTSALTAATAAQTFCEPSYYDPTDNRIHVFCTGPGFAELHVDCFPFIWRDAGTNIIGNGRIELALGCGADAIISHYAEIHK
jgi:hypothetical protein